MKNIFKTILVLLFISTQVHAQNYYFENYQPFNAEIPTPEEFFGYPIGDYHTRHDLVVAYFYKLAELSDRVSIEQYGKTNEHRQLLMLTVTSPKNLKQLTSFKKKHLASVFGDENSSADKEPIFINLGYNVHGNEPSSTEAALLTAYTLVASENETILNYLDESVIFIDPTINPDGRDRHSNWVNTFRGQPLIADKNDIEHNEAWPRGRTNHYWFDLNRDWLLAVQPESNAKLKWYHNWYPTIVTDFHEMGTSSTYFFEPKPPSAALNPVTPDENYSKLTMLFGNEYAKELDKIGSLYFTKERYDATYPGYGSTYPDLHSSLSILFEQASSRGHVQETPTGDLTFAFTIRNQYISSLSTVKTAIDNKEMLLDYQYRFFKESEAKGSKSTVKGYVFGDNYDTQRTNEFINLLLKHQVEVYPLKEDINIKNQKLKKESGYYVPMEQKQHYMVQTAFETYEKYRDSVYYDASAWSLVNFYNMTYKGVTKKPSIGTQVLETNPGQIKEVAKSKYAYLFSWNDYYAPALLFDLQKNGLIVKASQKSFTTNADGKSTEFNKGTLLIATGIQNKTNDEIHQIVNYLSKKHKIQAHTVSTGLSIKGIDLGSSNFVTTQQPKIMMLVEGGVSSYEAGEVWHLLEQRMQMPIAKVPERLFYRTDLDRYNIIVLVSGSYSLLKESHRQKLKDWVAKGNTLITQRTASSWAIRNKLVNESFVKTIKDTSTQRLNYGESREHNGKHSIGGAIFEVDLDITHPIAYGYHNRSLPVYKNNRIWIAPSKNKFSTVAKYTNDPHIDGFSTQENIDNYMIKSASIVVSRIEKGRVILFADNPNFRGAWYGTNKLFMNSIFFGSFISVP